MENLDSRESALGNALTYPEYLALIERLHTEEKATSFQDNASFYKYSVLGLSRMKRIHKKMELLPELVNAIQSIEGKQHWLIITESWCGDASQTVPIMIRMAEENSNVQAKIVLRDSNLDYMDLYRTNGSISIPVLVVHDENWNELFHWGPRPAPAQQKVMEYKALPEPRPPYEELSTELQKWYNADKGITTQKELLSLFSK
ncbi:MAG: thioredoxin family protein [Bacteroidota bacterium]